MEYGSYAVTSHGKLEFDFFSEGPKGRIAKRVAYTPTEASPEIYNLGFGDLDETGFVDDRVVTNNGDTMKVLTTVAMTVVEFFRIHPDKVIVLEGSTETRTRFYKMMISH